MFFGKLKKVYVGGYLNDSKVETKSLEWIDLSIEARHHYFTKK